MPYFSLESRKNMEGIHPDLAYVLHYAINYLDFKVVEGVRSTERQQTLFHQDPPVTTIDGVSKLSKHQIQPSTGYGHAVDLYPYPIDDLSSLSGIRREKALRRFVALAFFIKGLWEAMRRQEQVHGSLRWGGDWDSDFDFNDQRFDDLPHIEIIPDNK